MNEWMNEWNRKQIELKWMNEWMIWKWTNEIKWMDEWKGVNEWVNETKLMKGRQTETVR